MENRYLNIVIAQDKNKNRFYVRIMGRTDDDSFNRNDIKDNISLVTDFNKATIFDCTDTDIDLSLEYIRGIGYSATVIKVSTLMFDNPEKNFNVGQTKLNLSKLG